MKLHMLQYPKNCSPTPPISFNANPNIINKPEKNQDSLKVEIRTHPGGGSSETVYPYLPIFKNG